MRRSLIFLTLGMGAVRLLLAARENSTADVPIDIAAVPELKQDPIRRPITGCFGMVWPSIRGIRYLPDPQERLLADLARDPLR